MNYFLAKTDPETYSIEDFERDKETTWDGINSAQALQAIKAMMPGDKVFIYHSMSKAMILGIAEVTSVARPDPKSLKSWVVDLRFLGRLKEPVGLREIKETGLFDDWNLVYQSRLSTMKVPEKFVMWMRDVKKLKI